MTLREFNNLPFEKAKEEILRCCGSTRWATEMIELRPFDTLDSAFEAAEKIWNRLSPSDWKEAFARHPRIGDLNSLRKRFPSTAEWAGAEQAGVNSASEEVLKNLAEGNRAYEEKFGYVFIVSAAGKSAEEMLKQLRVRLKNGPDRELLIAAEEQDKITRIRLEKLFSL